VVEVTALTDGGARVADAAPPAARVLAATITCLARWGLAKTTLDDIAREAGVSRATVYRLFPGGKDVVVRAAVEAELQAAEQDLARRLAGVDDVEEVVVAVLTWGTRALTEHEALRTLLAHEPEHVLPHLAFAELDHVLDRAARALTPWLDPRPAEWLARVVLSHWLLPSSHHDLADEASARRFARTFLLPGLRPKEPPRG
jgi:AcrR family transcriptional regulator